MAGRKKSCKYGGSSEHELMKFAHSTMCLDNRILIEMEKFQNGCVLKFPLY